MVAQAEALRAVLVAGPRSVRELGELGTGFAGSLGLWVFSDRNSFSVGAVLVDGRVAGSWSIRDGRVVVTAFREFTRAERDAVEEERARLETFHA